MLLKTVVTVAVIGIIASLCFQPDAPITGFKTILGTQGYDITVLEAPVAKSTLLDVLSFALTRTRFGPAIRRHLLNNNKIADLRDLASQIELPPMSFPMRRVNAQHYDELTSTEAVEQAQSIVKDGFESNYLSSQDLFPRTISEYHAFYQAGKGLPSAVMARTLETIHAWEAQGFRVFSSILSEEVEQAAKESDLRWREGRPLSVFDGVPVAFKDMMDVKGHVIYEGRNPSPEHKKEWVLAQQDDPMVARLRSLGAIVLGMTIEVEGGVSPLGWNAHFQGPVSPYSFNRYSGGSSSGSAVAVATGLVPVAIGYDGGGSIRIPASMSGVHGLATTFGRIPFNNHTSTTMIKGGPLAASSQDAALAYAVIAENKVGSFYNELYDGGVRGPPSPHLDRFSDIQDLSDVRVGIFHEWFNDAAPLIKERSDQVVSFLKSRGATVVPIQIPHLQLMSMAHAMKISTEFALGWDTHFHTYPDSMEPGGRIVVGLGSTVTALEALCADKIRAWAFEYVTKMFTELKLTAIVNPTMGVEVPILSEEAKLRGESNTVLSVKVMKHIFIANLLGLPGYSVPVGFVQSQEQYPGDAQDLKLPMGFHLLGDHWTDHKLLRLAHSIEEGFSRKLSDRPKPMFLHDPLVV
eukprot:gene13916-16003_t